MSGDCKIPEKFLEESKEAQQISQLEESKDVLMPVESDEQRIVSVKEMDGRLEEAFLRAWVELIKNEDLPMEASTFQRDYLSLYADKDFKLELKQSSFKKVGF